MKNLNASQKSSRRNFTKSAAAAFVAAPLASLQTNAEVVNTETQTEEKNKQNQKQSTTKQRSQSKLLVHEHIPPLGVGGGSFFIELYHQLERISDGSAPRPQRYTAPNDTGRRYGDIYSIRVLTEVEDEYEKRDYYFPLGVRPQLRLWFQNWNGTGFDDITTSPNVVIKGGDTTIASQLLIEIENPQGGGPTLQRDPLHHKEHRKQKHRHKGRGAQGFRIGGWQIADSGGRPFPDLEEYGYDGYYLFVSFYNPDRT